MEGNLNELGSFKNGLNFKKEKMGSGYPLINVKDITSNIRLKSGMLDLVDVSIEGSSASYLAKIGDIFFVRSSVKREGVGMVGMLEDDDEKTVHCGFVIRFRPNQKIIYPKFLLYLLSSPYWRESVRNLSGGTAIINISQGALKTLNVRFPESLQIQKRIADIISAYDDLIENNLKRINLLEQAAQNIYKEWFVNMRFPGYESAEFDSETGLPEGWLKNKSNDVFEINIGKTPPRKESEWFSSSNGVKWVSISDMNKSRVYLKNTSERITIEGVQKHNVKIVPKGTVLLSFKLTVGAVGIVSENMVTNEAIAHFNINERTPSTNYTYLYLKNFPYNTLGSTSSIGTALNSKIVKSLEFITPQLEVLSKFDEIVTPIFSQIENLVDQNLLLTKSRDILLPRLMNQTIEV